MTTPVQIKSALRTTTTARPPPGIYESDIEQTFIAAVTMALAYRYQYRSLWPGELLVMGGGVEPIRRHSCMIDPQTTFSSVLAAIHNEPGEAVPPLLPDKDCEAALLVLVIGEWNPALPIPADAICIENLGSTYRMAYDRTLHSESFVARLMNHFDRAFELFTVDPGTKLSSAALLTDEELQSLAWGNGNWPHIEASFGTVHETVECMARNDPAASAIEVGDRIVSYKELNERANALALAIATTGIGTGVIVATALERSVDFVVALLGILKSGNAYLPLDVLLPQERLAFMVEDCDCPLIIVGVEGSPVSRMNMIELPISDVRESEDRAPKLAAAGEPSSAAYVNYTSGSTGRPKGVAVPHSAIMRLIIDPNYVRLDRGTRILQLANIAFDAATFEIWGALMNGGCLILYGEKHVGLRTLGRCLAEYRIDTLFLTTALFNAIVDGSIDILKNTKQILTGGEAHSVKHMVIAREKLDNTALSSVYGPTECTTFASHFPIKDLDIAAPSVPIGKAINDTQLVVIDENFNLMPCGIIGEIAIGGLGLSLGYVNLEEQTRDRFVSEVQGFPRDYRLYRTGDFGRLLPSGDIEFLGRRDDQVKIDGFRIELSEVEHVLNNLECVARAIVLAKPDESGSKRLVACLIASGERPVNANVAAALRKILPTYMIPSEFRWLTSFPLNANGKVDRRALLAQQ